MTSEPPYLYRFRKVSALLDEHNELGAQEIYFASPAELNDPMEGFREIYWQGDQIVWRNLFRNYIFCLERLCLMLPLVGETEPLSAKMIPIIENDRQFPTDEARNISKAISDAFFGNPTIEKFINRISARLRPIRRNELHSYFLSVHHVALETILQEFDARGLKLRNSGATSMVDIEEMVRQKTSSIDLIEQWEREKPDANSELFFAASRHVQEQMDLIAQSNYLNLLGFKNRDFVIRDFPSEYLNKLEELIYPEWYTACFMSDCSNSSVWGHYGDKHQGVCLKFKSTLVSERASLNLNCVTAWGSEGAIFGIRGHQFHKVNYSKDNVEVDFFKSLGRLPIPALIKYWYGNAQGELSKCAEEAIAPSNKQWREKYWERFYHGVTTKNEDWKHENEYRLVLTGSFHDYSESSTRKLKYNFSELDGVIFGIKTKLEDKLKIMSIIGDKCRKEGRKEFNFYQAFYSKEKACMDFALLNLIKFP